MTKAHFYVNAASCFLFSKMETKFNLEKNSHCFVKIITLEVDTLKYIYMRGGGERERKEGTVPELKQVLDARN